MKLALLGLLLAAGLVLLRHLSRKEEPDWPETTSYEPRVYGWQW